jgi:His-Xaa-Ser system protein HxsD
MTEPETAAADEHADFTFELSEREITFVIDEDLYALDAIYGACYGFIDRVWVFLSRPGAGSVEPGLDRKVRVRLRSKKGASEETLESLAGEFANELLNSQLRFRIGRATASIREQYMARAFGASSRNATIAELLAELDAEELEEEPLEIPVPWKGVDVEQASPKGEETDG